MYSWGGVGQKFPNDEKNFRIYHGILSHEGVCYSENEDTICKQKYAYFTHRHILIEKQCRRELLFIGGRKRRPEEIFKFRVSEMQFPGLWGSFDRMLMVRKKRLSMSKFTICLQFIVTIQFCNIFSV